MTAARLVRGTLAVLLALSCRAPDDATRRAALPDVVLVTIESLRSDHVGAYGGRSATRPEQPITPTLDALAEEAVLYSDAHSVTSWTLSSHASLFTGLYPSAHRTRRPRSRLGDAHRTLAELLADAGYQTAAVVSGPYLRESYNLTQGFEQVDESSANPLQPRAHADVTNPAVERGLLRFVELERDPDRPFFLFAYLWDPHYDYLPPPPWDAIFVDESCERVDLRDFDTTDRVNASSSPGELAWVLSQYDGEIRATDEMLGRFFTLLRGRGLWDDALVIVTADHGEEFFEHGEKGHKNNLYDETVRVPLLVKYPAGTRGAPPPGARDDRLVSLVDVLPTVLDLLGLEAPRPLHGRSLLGEADPDRPILHELLSVRYAQEPGRVADETGSWIALRRGRHKLVARQPERGEAVRELFDLVDDPGEQRSLASSRPGLLAELAGLAGELRARARADARGFGEPGLARLSAAQAERLRALGYLVDERGGVGRERRERPNEP